MSKTSHVRQTAGSTQSAVAVQYPVPSEIFQLIDPPSKGRSPEKMTHRDCEIFKVSVTATTRGTFDAVAGTNDTIFTVLLDDGELDGNGDPIRTDILDGDGLLVQADDPDAPTVGLYDEWWLVPRPTLHGGLTRISVEVTTLGKGVRGLIFEVLFL